MIRVLDNHKFRPFQALNHPLTIGHRGDRVGPDDPDGFDFTRRQFFKERNGVQARLGLDGSRWHAPNLFDPSAVGGILDSALSGQPLAQIADFAATHRIRLAGQGEGPAARPTDFSGGEMQIADCIGVPGPVRALVQTHGPEGGELSRFSDPARGGAEVCLAQIRHARDAGGRIIFQQRAQFLPAFSVGRDERLIDASGLIQQMQQAVEQRQIGAGLDPQKQIRLGGRRGVARVNDNQPRSPLPAIEQTLEKNRVAFRHVRADDQKPIRAVQVLIGAGRTIRAQGEFVTAGRTRHAQARIGVDVVRAQKSLGQLAREVLRFHGELAGNIERDRVRPMFGNDSRQALTNLGQREAQGKLLTAQIPPFPRVSKDQPIGRGQRLGARNALRAKPAEIGGMLLVANDFIDAAAADLQNHATTNPAIRADGADILAHGF